MLLFVQLHACYVTINVYFTNNNAANGDGRETVLVRRKQEEQNERDKMTKGRNKN
jgi:hypothetical protein